MRNEIIEVRTNKLQDAIVEAGYQWFDGYSEQLLFKANHGNTLIVDIMEDRFECYVYDEIDEEDKYETTVKTAKGVIGFIKKYGHYTNRIQEGRN